MRATRCVECLETAVRRGVCGICGAVEEEAKRRKKVRREELAVSVAADVSSREEVDEEKGSAKDEYHLEWQASMAQHRFFRDTGSELGISEHAMQNIVSLLSEHNSVPFILRYRKAMTENIEEGKMNVLVERMHTFQALQKRRQAIEKALSKESLLTSTLVSALHDCTTLAELEDLYLPYKKERKTKASLAREKGYGPVAEAVFNGLIVDGSALSRQCKDIKDPKESYDALHEGIMTIVADLINKCPERRKALRAELWRRGELTSCRAKKEGKQDERSNNSRSNNSADTYRAYFDYRQSLSRIKPHQMMAMNRGKREGFLQVAVSIDKQMMTRCLSNARRKLWSEQKVRFPRGKPLQLLEEAEDYAYSRLLRPSLVNEVLSELTEKACVASIDVFQNNLRSVLEAAPLANRCILGVDPAFRTGCKLACISPVGRVLSLEPSFKAIIYPNQPHNKVEEATAELIRICESLKVDVVAIGNGTASFETATFVSQTLPKIKRDVRFCIVSEAGASVYSVSEEALEEFPNLAPEQRSAISIARRLQDPLAELVKIPPRSIGIGMYQHDVDERRLSRALDSTVELSVNRIGIDLNTASVSLLRRVSGLSLNRARAIAKWRQSDRRFSSREQLLKVPGIGEQTFTQCSGFMRVRGSSEWLDETQIHPEQYENTKFLLSSLGLDTSRPASLAEFGQKFRALWSVKKKKDIRGTATELGIDEYTMADIVECLSKPGIDPRESVPEPVLRSSVLTLDQVHRGLILSGTVENFAAFGCFVDIGLKRSGLVPSSELSGATLATHGIGTSVQVMVINVDPRSGKVGLSFDVSKKLSPTAPSGLASSSRTRASKSPSKRKSSRNDRELDGMTKKKVKTEKKDRTEQKEKGRRPDSRSGTDGGSGGNGMFSLFVRNVPFTWDEDKLFEVFSQYGSIFSSVVMRTNGRSRGCGLVHMASRVAGDSAIQALNGVNFEGRTIYVAWSKKR